MIATLNELVKSIQGSLGSNTYARRMAESGKIIIQRKPNRKLKRGQKLTVNLTGIYVKKLTHK